MCEQCDGMIVMDRGFLSELQNALAQTSVELVAFCNKKRIDFRTLPALEKLGQCIREFEDIR